MVSSRVPLLLFAGFLSLSCGGGEMSAPCDCPVFEASLPATTWVEAVGGRCPVLTVTLTGSGPATPGGSLTVNGSHCLDPGTPASPDSFPRISDGQFVFTFASGATLTGEYAGNLVLTETGLYDVLVDFFFNGGTGDFAGSGGGVSFVGRPDSPPGRLDRQTGQATQLWLYGLITPE